MKPPQRAPSRLMRVVALATLLPGLALAQPAAPTERPLADSARATVRTVWHGAQDVAVFALSLIGVDYRFGGNTPDVGLDCSGLIQYVFQQVTGATLPRTALEMSRLGKKVALADLRPGDLVFFNTRHFAFSHVGLYLGDDRFIHAPHQGGEVEVVALSAAYWQKRFMGARRIVGVLPNLVPAVISSAQAASATGTVEAADTLPPETGRGVANLLRSTSRTAAQ